MFEVSYRYGYDTCVHLIKEAGYREARDIWDAITRMSGKGKATNVRDVISKYNKGHLGRNLKEDIDTAMYINKLQRELHAPELADYASKARTRGLTKEEVNSLMSTPYYKKRRAAEADRDANVAMYESLKLPNREI